MALTIKDVQKIAHLARLSVPTEDIQPLADQLSGILDFVSQMNTVNTDKINAIAHSLEMSQRLRPDIVTEPDQRADCQKIAPAVDAGLYLVPKVIESV